MKTLLITFWFVLPMMAGNVTLINDTIFDAKFHFHIDELSTAQIFDVPAKGSVFISLKEYLAPKPQQNYVVVKAEGGGFEVCCHPQFSVENFLKDDFTISFLGSVFPFSQCTIVKNSSL